MLCHPSKSQDLLSRSLVLPQAFYQYHTCYWSALTTYDSGCLSVPIPIQSHSHSASSHFLHPSKPQSQSTSSHHQPAQYTITPSVSNVPIATFTHHPGDLLLFSACPLYTLFRSTVHINIWKFFLSYICNSHFFTKSLIQNAGVLAGSAHWCSLPSRLHINFFHSVHRSLYFGGSDFLKIFVALHFFRTSFAINLLCQAPYISLACSSVPLFKSALNRSGFRYQNGKWDFVAK